MHKLYKMSSRAVAVLLIFSLAVTSVYVQNIGTSAAAKKVTKVSIVKPSTTNLVIKKGKTYKLNVTVKATKSAYKKVTYKSSAPAKVSVSSSGVVKGLKSGSAKITVTSKTDAKKKDTITVRVGNPITSLTLSGSRLVYQKYYEDVKNVLTGKITKVLKVRNVYTKLFANKAVAAVTTKLNDAIELTPGYSAKATYKHVKYATSNAKVATVNDSGLVLTLTKGTAVITATSKDGSNKVARLTVTVAPPVVDPTKVPVYETEKRTVKVVEDFESYAVGTTWATHTQGLDFAGKKCGTMTVVKDPENAANKCLKIQYNGTTQAYDYAPVFSLKLPKVLGDYSAMQIQSRVVSNAKDCTYKTIAGYFGKKGTITSDYYFDTTWSKPANATAKEIELRKFGVNVSMVKGEDKDYNVKSGAFAGMQYNNKTFPMYYADWATSKVDKNRSLGFKETETYKNVGWATNTLNMQMTNIKTADPTLLTTKYVDFAVGSTYGGKYTNGEYVTVYIDNVACLEGIVEITGLDVNVGATTITEGLSTSLNTDDDVIYTPANTTQKELTWKSSDPSVATIALVNGKQRIEALKQGTTTITATSTVNAKATKSFIITVVPRTLATQEFNVDISKLVATPAPSASPMPAVYSNVVGNYNATTKELTIPYTKSNSEWVAIDLGAGGMDLTQYKGMAITGNVPEQTSFEIYPDGTDFSKDNWWKFQCDWITYPFFQGSVLERSYEGTVHGDPGDETVRCNWDSNGNSGTDNHSGYALRGSMKKSRYIIIKANKFKAGAYVIKGIKFMTTDYENTRKKDVDYPQG